MSSPFRCVAILLLLGASALFGPSSRVFGQSRMLDDLDRLEGWRVVTSEGAKLDIASGPGKSGQAMVMNFDLSGVYGYVIAQKDFPIELPPNYQFTFDMRAEAPVNNFEFKLFDEKENVFWIKKLNITYPADWERQRIKKRHLSFAWGPARTDVIRSVRKIEFVVSVGSGGTGKVYIDNFRFEPIDEEAAKSARTEVVTPEGAAVSAVQIDPAGRMLTGFTSEAQRDSLIVNFNHQREIGGLVIDWDSVAYAFAYDVLLSDDGRDWATAYRVKNGNGGRDFVYLHEGEGRFMKLRLVSSRHGGGFHIRRMQLKEPGFSASPNAFFKALAAEAPPGYFPKYLLDKASFWTVMGVSGDMKEAMMNEQGQIELDKLQASLEPFLYVNGKLVTWNDVKIRQSLEGGYLPIPAVTWQSNEWGSLTVEAFAAGVPERSLLGIRYAVESKVPDGKFRLFVAIRPFQVNPPWQQLNADGGFAPVDQISVADGIVRVNSLSIIPLTAPTGFGAADFDNGHITDYMVQGRVPESKEATDPRGFASAAFLYDMELGAGQMQEVFLAVPFHGYRGDPRPNMGPSAGTYYHAMRSTTASGLRQQLNNIRISLPPSAPPIANTIKSQLAYIFINRDSAGIQPGSRSYERSWIRDGSLTCAAMLRLGILAEVRQFIDWYAKGQFPSGKIPCVVDHRGPDAVSEHDSHGQFIYAVAEYFRFSKDTTWLRGKRDAVVKTVRYIQSLRAERKTDVYKTGTDEQRACYGLVPESISHEGYWDVPRHSYWDDFFIMKGLKDAVEIAAVLGEKELQKEFEAERDDFRKDLYASMRLAMKNKNISYIPGCVELGDFDATSTTVGVYPCNELGNIPEPELHNTFDKYYSFFRDRETTGKYENYTPYETRVIGTFAVLGQKDRVEDAVTFFMNDRRPQEWNQWQEVVWRDRDTPKFIGDSPHTWVGSDFIRSIITMFVHDRDRDGAHVLANAIPDTWIRDSAGVQVDGISTFHGKIGYSIAWKGGKTVAVAESGKEGRKAAVSGGESVTVSVGGTFDAARHKLVLKSPLSARPKTVRLEGRRVVIPKDGEIVLKKLPAKVEFTY